MTYMLLFTYEPVAHTHDTVLANLDVIVLVINE